MLFSLRILSILALSMIFAQQTYASPEKRCGACKMLLTEVEKVLEIGTEFTEQELDQTIKKVCDKRSRVMEGICEYFGKEILSELFQWIEEKEEEFDVEEGGWGVTHYTNRNRFLAFSHPCFGPIGHISNHQSNKIIRRGQIGAGQS
ncbi:hypothetical protein KIN20_032918 [Parelaphostrongylus tenuis]|uniref:Saposin B-type domain-containing protein n=1 Tax=Parelaphostrongylus tenuis TaxID=148309 RepID=A0AAD5WIU4_PARTN|nr:hypothetical protein KIN20_032918 [Parelaphostrongylus tenuis]